MTDEEHRAGDQGASCERVRGIRRRRFLMGLGAGGLAAAEALFGSTPDAAAAYCGCCHLAHCPPNTSYSGCRSVWNYTWTCSPGGGASCACCEVLPNYSASGYYCWGHAPTG